MSNEFDEAREALRKAEADYGTAESNLIKARQRYRDVERDFLRGLFPTMQAVWDYFKS